MGIEILKSIGIALGILAAGLAVIVLLMMLFAYVPGAGVGIMLLVILAVIAFAVYTARGN